MPQVAPSRVRGLKQNAVETLARRWSRTLTGAWIETLLSKALVKFHGVAPSRVRELKGLRNRQRSQGAGRTLTGARIESQKRLPGSKSWTVASSRDVFI